MASRSGAVPRLRRRQGPWSPDGFWRTVFDLASGVYSLSKGYTASPFKWSA